MAVVVPPFLTISITSVNPENSNGYLTTNNISTFFVVGAILNLCRLSIMPCYSLV